MNKDVKIVAKSVNNKNLYNQIHKTIFEAITTLGVRWTSESHRLSFVEVIEEFLFDLQTEGKLSQVKVICDRRNNKSFSSEADKYVFEVQYKQPHCLNTTIIEYHVANGPKKR